MGGNATAQDKATGDGQGRRGFVDRSHFAHLPSGVGFPFALTDVSQAVRPGRKMGDTQEAMKKVSAVGFGVAIRRVRGGVRSESPVDSQDLAGHERGFVGSEERNG